MSAKPAEPKEIDGVVNGCPFCLTEFKEAQPANARITCGGCDKEFLVRKF